MTAVWPVTLPQSTLAEGFAEHHPGAGRYGFKPRVGNAITRPATAQRNYEQPIKLKLSPAQKIILENFYYTTLKQGSLPFTWIKFDTLAAIDYVWADGVGLDFTSQDAGISYFVEFTLVVSP